MKITIRKEDSAAIWRDGKGIYIGDLNLPLDFVAAFNRWLSAAYLKDYALEEFHETGKALAARLQDLFGSSAVVTYEVAHGILGEKRQIRCLGIDHQERTFDYKLSDVEENMETGLAHWTFHVLNPDNHNRFFEFTVELRPDAVRLVVMDNHFHEEFAKKGIPDALILEMRRRFGIPVCSTSNLARDTEGFRNSAADKVWSRLVLAGEAVYDKSQDRYTTTH